jgi:hypothetical protein
VRASRLLIIPRVRASRLLIIPLYQMIRNDHALNQGMRMKAMICGS